MRFLMIPIGKDSSMSGNVKFIIETASIDAPDAE